MVHEQGIVPAQMQIPQVATEPSGWFESLQHKLQVHTIMESLNLSANRIFELASFVLVGFFAGFLLKKYFKSFIFSVVLVVIAVKVLEAYNVVVIDWNQLQVLSGVHPTDTLDVTFNLYIEWVKENIVPVLSVFIGFFIGFKIG